MQSLPATASHYRNKRLRREMLIERKGVRLLCEMLKGSLTEEMHTAVESLAALAEGLEPVPPSTSEKNGGTNSPDYAHVGPNRTRIMVKASGTKQVKVETVSKEETTTVAMVALPKSDVHGCCYTEMAGQRAFDVYFKTDGGEVTGAHRDMLAATTDVFSAMLSKCFLEATQMEVTLPEMSSEVFMFTLHCAYGCETSTCATMLSILKTFKTGRAECDALFGLLACADRFIFEKLRGLSEKLLIASMHSSDDAIKFCILGTHFHSALLCEVGLCYLLAGPSSALIRRQAFQKIFSSSEKLLIVDHLCEILESHVIGNI